MAFYIFRETLEIIVNCKSTNDIHKTSDIVFVYKKSFCLNDLRRLKILMKSQYNFLKQKQ